VPLQCRKLVNFDTIEVPRVLLQSPSTFLQRSFVIGIVQVSDFITSNLIYRVVSKFLHVVTVKYQPCAFATLRDGFDVGGRHVQRNRFKLTTAFLAKLIKKRLERVSVLSRFHPYHLFTKVVDNDREVFVMAKV